MKILVLGDSHTAAVKYGWDAIAADHPDKQLDFFALPKLRMNTLKAQGGRIMLADRAKKGDKRRFADQFPAGHVVAADYDAIFLVGLVETGHSLIVANQHTMLPEQVQSRRGHFLGFGKRNAVPPDDAPLGTRAMFAAAWDCIYEAATARSVLKQMNKLGTPPCYWAVNPMISQAALVPNHPLRAAFTAVMARGDAQIFLDIAREGTAAKLPAHVRLIAQPPQTIHKTCMTKTAYMTAAKTFYKEDATFGKRDVLHANEKYGILLLNALFDAIAHQETRP